MPWCPNCKTEYDPGTKVCSDCGRRLVHLLDSLSAGALGAIVGWVASFCVLCVSRVELNPGFPLLPVVVGVIGFSIGRHSTATFMSCLIGWLIISAPIYMFAGMGYAHEDTPTPIPVANLMWSALLSPLLFGPLSTVAGTRYRHNHRAGLLLWLVPTGLAVACLLVATIAIGPAE